MSLVSTLGNTVAARSLNGTLSRLPSICGIVHTHTFDSFEKREREKSRGFAPSLLGCRSNRQTRLVSLITTDETRERRGGLNNPVIDSKVDAKRINAI